MTVIVLCSEAEIASLGITIMKEWVDELKSHRYILSSLIFFPSVSVYTSFVTVSNIVSTW
jgi:hypothetical protein